MAIYYVDPVNGSPANNGLSADTPIKTNVGLNVRPGDTVLLIGAGNVNTVWDIIKNDRNAKM
mgnify:CR=1 FL=1